MAKRKGYVDRLLRENMAMIVAAYRKATGLAIATISSKFYGHPSALQTYLSGKSSITASKYDELLTKIRADWPKDGDWPLGPAVIIRGPHERG
jgi:hypothetical protein